ncbi:MAG: acetylxylan esterase [Bryobacterales bacterium]|nr:acetylxylan esterase [Bryobacterales bacterium]
MRTLGSLLLVTAGLLGQIPAQDARNTKIPNTDTHFRMPAYRSLAEWEARRAKLRSQILAAAGLLPMPERTPLNPQIFGRIEHQDYSIEKVLLETLPGYYLGGNLYRPLGRSGRLPAVASPHGHWNYGRLEHQPLASIPARCINLARQGYVVFAYDMAGYNDTIQTPHTFGGPAEQLWSFSPLGLQLWNSIRAVDFLQSLPEVDPERIGATGASGGGTQTFLLAAVDDRIRFAAPVNMVSAIMQGGCVCENAPNLRLGTFNVEFAAMMAPRPLLLVSATGDWTRNTPREEFPAVRAIYELYGKPENVENAHMDAPHNYNQASREAVYRFFGKHVLGETDPGKLAERSIRVERLQDMLALHNRTLPPGSLDYAGLFRLWKEIARRQVAECRDPGTLRERMLANVAVEWPEQVLSQIQGERILLGRAGEGDRVAGVWIEGSGPPVLLVHQDGAEAARRSPEATELLKARRPVLMIDAFQTGAAVAPRDRSHRHFLCFNRSDDANRLQDILTALRWLSQKRPGPVELLGLGKARVWCLFAAALAPNDVRLLSGAGEFGGTDREFIEQFFVPGIQRAGGLEAALRIIAARRRGA